MIQELVEKYRIALDLFFKEVDAEALNSLFNLFKACKGLLFFSGIGKSALVGEKIAVTMTATGTRALFIPPIEAMHGDVGLLTKEDLFIAISKSGEAEELLNLFPYVRNKGAKIIAMTSNPKSRMAEAADFQLIVPFAEELCPFNMAPTISTTTQTILGDILAVALMQSKKFTLSDYAMNHPAGTIGKRIIVKVKDLMLTGDKIPLCKPEDHLLDILVELSNKRAGCVLIVDAHGELLGIFTDGDLRRALQQWGSEVLEKRMDALMTKGGRIIGPEALAWDALKMMENQQKSPIMVLPVLDEKRHVLGILKMHDILQSGI